MQILLQLLHAKHPRWDVAGIVLITAEGVQPSAATTHSKPFA